MFRSLRTLSVAVLVAVPTVLAAQQNTRAIQIGASGGLSLPMGSLGDGAKSGYVIAGHVYYQPSGFKSLGYRADVSLDKWSSKVAGIDLRSLGVVANAIYHLPSSTASTVHPYVLGGVGMFNSKSSGQSLGVTYSSTNTDVGVQVGGGIDFALSGFSTFVEAKYVNVFSSGGTKWIPISFGFRF